MSATQGKVEMPSSVSNIHEYNNGIEDLLTLLRSAHRCIAAPLNPTYSKSEVSFYLSDAKSKLLLVHRSAIKDNAPAVQAARELSIAVAEVWYDSKKGKVGVQLEKRDRGVSAARRFEGSGKPREDDVALLLHTSGTTGRPKAVPLTHKNLITTHRNIINTYKLTEKDKSFLVMPGFHVHGSFLSNL